MRLQKCQTPNDGQLRDRDNFSKLTQIWDFSGILTLGARIYVVANFLSQVIFVFLLFLGMVMYANEI